MEALQGIPKGSTALFSYCDARQTGNWCIFDTEDPEGLNNYCIKAVPEMHVTDTIPIFQFFPPGPELYKFVHVLAGM